jgi:hypothetical protein
MQVKAKETRSQRREEAEYRKGEGRKEATSEESGRRYPPCFPRQPLINSIPHGLANCSLHPGHEGTIKLEMLTATPLEKAPHVLRIAVTDIDQGSAINRVAMPVEISHPTAPKT